MFNENISFSTFRQNNLRQNCWKMAWLRHKNSLEKRSIRGTVEQELKCCARQENGELPGSRAPWNQSWGRGINAEPGPPYLKEKSQLEPSRDGGDMRRDRE
jgi:hypothetical protein